MKGRKVVGKVGVKCRIRRVLYSIRVRSEQKRKLFEKKRTYVLIRQIIGQQVHDQRLVRQAIPTEWRS